jgi:hypothetical protein
MRIAAAVRTGALDPKVRRKFQLLSRLLTGSARHVLRYWCNSFIKIAARILSQLDLSKDPCRKFIIKH